MATADIEADTVLFTIPRNAVICPLTSTLAIKVPSIFEDGGSHLDEDDDEADRGQDSWTSLILIMIYEHLQGDKSPWKPYLDVLPTEFNTLMFWSGDELKELQASSVVAKIGKAEADTMICTKIIPAIREFDDVFFHDGVERLSNEALMALAHRMGSIIMAYAFDLDRDEDEDGNGGEENDGWVEDRDGKRMMGMVPMADILNADAEFNVSSGLSKVASDFSLNVADILTRLT